MPHINVKCRPPSHGWLALKLKVNEHTIKIDASDVPNNPMQELLFALDNAAHGMEASVWWNLEPDGYFMRFTPVGSEVEFALDFAIRSERAQSRPVLSARGSRSTVLLPFWRFVRDFQSRSYQEPHWPSVNYERIHAVKLSLASETESNQKSQRTLDGTAKF